MVVLSPRGLQVIRMLIQAIPLQRRSELSLDVICNKNKLRLFPSVRATVEPHSAEVLVRILLIQQTDVCEWKVTTSAIAFSFPLTTHVNLCDLYQLTDLWGKKYTGYRPETRAGSAATPPCCASPTCTRYTPRKSSFSPGSVCDTSMPPMPFTPRKYIKKCA